MLDTVQAQSNMTNQTSSQTQTFSQNQTMSKMSKHNDMKCPEIKDKLINTKQSLAGKNPHEALAMIISFYSLSVIETYNIYRFQT